MNVAAVYHNGVRKILEANLEIKNYDAPKFLRDISKIIYYKKCQKIIGNYCSEKF